MAISREEFENIDIIKTFLDLKKLKEIKSQTRCLSMNQLFLEKFAFLWFFFFKYHHECNMKTLIIFMGFMRFNQTWSVTFIEIFQYHKHC